MNLRISIEATGAYAHEANNYLAEYVELIEGTVPYIRRPEWFISEMMPAPDIEAPGQPPRFSIFASIDDRGKFLLASLVALRVNPNARSITSCIAHEALVFAHDELRQVCKDFVRLVADAQGGIRWQHKYNQLVRDMIDEATTQEPN